MSSVPPFFLICPNQVLFSLSSKYTLNPYTSLPLENCNSFVLIPRLPLFHPCNPFSAPLSYQITFLFKTFQWLPNSSDWLSNLYKSSPLSSSLTYPSLTEVQHTGLLLIPQVQQNALALGPLHQLSPLPRLLWHQNFLHWLPFIVQMSA